LYGDLISILILLTFNIQTNLQLNGNPSTCIYICISGHQAVFIFLLLATLAYLIGVFGVTICGNVPMNDRLDAFNISGATAETVRQMRESFENRWNFLNNIRTGFSVISIVLLVCACIRHKEI